MTKRLYTLRTGDWSWTGQKTISMTQGVLSGTLVPFTVEKIDVYWEAVKGAQLNDTFYMNWGFSDEAPDAEFQGVVQPSRYTLVGVAPDLAYCTALYRSIDYSGVAPGVRTQGPYAWSPGPGVSHHTFDLTEIGGLTVDKVNAYPTGCLNLLFWHDMAYYATSYRMIITISEDT